MDGGGWMQRFCRALCEKVDSGFGCAWVRGGEVGGADL